MPRAARSVLLFGCDLAPVGCGLLLAPDLVLAPWGFPPVADAWARIVGMLALGLAFYYVAAARAGLPAFFRWTVAVRIGVFVAFTALALLRVAPAGLALLGAVDLAGVFGTTLALRAAR